MHKNTLPHPQINLVILLGETVKATLTLWLVFISPYAKWIIPFYLLIQCFSSPVQGGKSDTISRKNTLLVTVFATALAQVFFIFSMLAFSHPIVNTLLLICGLIIHGRWGNISAIARASLSDTESHLILTFTLPLSFAILSLPWIAILNFFPDNLPENAYHKLHLIPFSISITLFFLSIILFLYLKRHFIDTEDNVLLCNSKNSDKELSDIINSKGFKRIYFNAKHEFYFYPMELKKTKEIISKKISGWFGGFFHQLGFHSIFYYLDETGLFVKENSASQYSLFIYFILGTLLKTLFFNSVKIGILIGVLICALSALIVLKIPNALTLWQGLLGLGAGLFLSCFYLHFLTNQKIHERGKIVGAADSMQTFGEISGSLIFSLVQSFLALSFLKEIAPFIKEEIRFLPLFLFVCSFILFIHHFLNERKNHKNDQNNKDEVLLEII